MRRRKIPTSLMRTPITTPPFRPQMRQTIADEVQRQLKPKKWPR